MAIGPPFVPQDRTYTPAEIAWFATKQWNVPFVFNDNAAIAVAVAMAESGGRQNAHNTKPPDDSYGLWQINMYGKLGPSRRAQFGISNNEALFDPTTNARAAFMIQRASGWKAWSTYKDGSYIKHMPAARDAIRSPQQPGNATGGEGHVDTRVGGKIIDAVITPVLEFVGQAGIRVAGFVGGAALIVVALRMYKKES